MTSASNNNNNSNISNNNSNNSNIKRSLSSNDISQYPMSTKNEAALLSDLQTVVEQMRTKNERMSLELTRLRQELASTQSQGTEQTSLNAQIAALQDQVRVLVEELQRAYVSGAKSDAADRQLSTRQDNAKFMSRLQKIIKNASSDSKPTAVRDVRDIFSSEPRKTPSDVSASSVLLKLLETPNSAEAFSDYSSNSDKTICVPTYVPKRIQHRPHRIMIPLVRVRDAHVQEIELLKSVNPIRKNQLLTQPRLLTERRGGMAMI